MRRRSSLAPLALLTACSFVLQDVNEGAPPERPPTCSDSYVYSIIDGIITVGGGVGFATAVRCSGSDCLGPVLAGIFIALPITIAYGLSTIYGVTRTRRCQQARILWTELVESRAPPFVPPPGASSNPARPAPDAGAPAMK